MSKNKAVHSHRTKSVSGPASFNGPALGVVNQNQSAHGGIREYHTCRCGAVKQVNHNGSHSEHGAWLIDELGRGPGSRHYGKPRKRVPFPSDFLSSMESSPGERSRVELAHRRARNQKAYIEGAVKFAESRKEWMVEASKKIESLERLIGETVDLIEAYADDHGSDFPTDVTVTLPELRRASGREREIVVIPQEDLFME